MPSAISARPGAGGRGERGHAAVRRADRHVHRRELVLGLQQRAADLRQRRRHPFQQLGRRRDRVCGDEAHAAADRAVAGRLVAADLPALSRRSAGRGEPRHAGDAGGGVDTGLQCGEVRRQRVAAALPRAGERRGKRRGRNPGQRTGHAQRHHVGPAAGDRLGRLLERHRDVARAARPEDVGRLALVRVADHDARRRERNLVGEARDVLPVDRQQQVEAVVERVDRDRREPDQRRRLAAADLRSAGADHEAVEPRLRRGAQQQRARGHHAAAAAAGQRDRDPRRRAARGTGARVFHRGLHHAPPCARSAEVTADRPIGFDADQGIGHPAPASCLP